MIGSRKQRFRTRWGFVLAGLVWLALLGGAQAAIASSPPPIPAAAQGHAYRHGVVPRRGQQPATSSPTAPSKNLSFGGGIGGVGVTTGPPRVYLVFWGSQWGTQGTNSQGDVTLSGDPDGMAAYLQDFMKGLGTGGETWSGVMTQYCQGVATGAQTCPSSNTQHVGYPTGGALAGVWVDESSAAPPQATANQIGAEAVNAAAHFGNLTSTSNRNIQYVVVSPTGTNPDGFNTSSGQFCAWHDYTTDVAASSPYGPLAFTNLPYIPDAGTSCGENFVNSTSSGTLDGVSIVEGHEYAETITDQFPTGGWSEVSGHSIDENGDKCAWITSGQGAAQNISLTTGTFAVQSTWANDFNSGAGGCEISHAIVTNPSSNTVTVSNPGNQTSSAEAPASLQIHASDSDTTQTLTYSATGLPAGLTISSSSGLISGTPTAETESSVTVTATDSIGASGSTTFTWTVTAQSTSTTGSPTTAAGVTPSGTGSSVTTSTSSSGASSASTCPAATGRLNGSTLGLVTLGMTRKQVRAAYQRSKLTASRYQDLFCLSQAGLRVGYPAPGVLSSLTHRQRAKLVGRVVWATTANQHYAAGGIKSGAKVATVKRALQTARVVSIGRVSWYFLTQPHATVLFKVRGGIVAEVGIASKQLTGTAKADSLLARSLS